MSIQFPIPIPSYPVASSISYTPIVVKASTVSPFTLEGEEFIHQGDGMVLTIQLPPMKLVNGKEWESFFLILERESGYFTFSDPLCTPRGTPIGNPVIDGNVIQRASKISTRGWNPDLTIFKASDYIELPNYRLHQVLLDTVSDMDGKAILEIFPKVRDSLSDGSIVKVDNPTGIFELMEHSIEIGEHKIYRINFTCRGKL